VTLKKMKIQSLLFCGLIFLIDSCQTNHSENKTTIEKKEINPSTQKFSVVDSLEKYYSADSVLLIDDSLGSTLFIRKANNCNYAGWVIPDSILVFFQHQSNEKWRATDTLKYKLDFSFSKHIDLNGDGFKDVRVSCFSGMAANTENRVFLFDPKTSSFKHNEYYDLPNVEYDSTNNFIKSWWFAGADHCQEKLKYSITGDSLTFDLGVSYCPDEKTQGATITFFKRIGANDITTKEISGKSDTLWSLFEQSFWDTSNE
jgi:hypothetical protein